MTLFPQARAIALEPIILGRLSVSLRGAIALESIMQGRLLIELKGAIAGSAFVSGDRHSVKGRSL